MNDPVTMQLIGDSLAYASEEMGLALRNAAYSPNIKERMDHSAAVFDWKGRLLAQAEHIPVHLGSLPWGLRNMLARCERDGLEMVRGEMVMANNPYITGTHLNDVTVVAPVYFRGALLGYVANKAHHSDVGGSVPGSISSSARTLSEEGVVIDPVVLVKRGALVKGAVLRLASASRTPSERMGDLRAQVAANVTGSRRVIEILSKYGAEAFRNSAGYMFSHSRRMVARRLSALREGTYEATDVLEGPQGEELRLRVKALVGEGRVDLDYTGTSREVDSPLNAVMGVTISGAYYVVRTLTGSDVPANHGSFLPVKVTVPGRSILNPSFPHPVGGGNVETSQRNADLVYRVLAKAAPGLVPAASGGSMNNVMIGGRAGRRRWAFYETIGVGLGGRAWMDGIDGIQCNMTNTMNTPIEEIERALPMTVTRYEFREDSSGAGEFRGGCGLVRAYRMESGRTIFTVLADRERHAPWGLGGGMGGATTRVFLVRRGRRRRVPSKTTMGLDRGDEVEIRTAGGGGYGRASSRARSRILADIDSGILRASTAREVYPGFDGPEEGGGTRSRRR
jgi:N-methylhydantoinase B